MFAPLIARKVAPAPSSRAKLEGRQSASPSEHGMGQSERDAGADFALSKAEGASGAGVFGLPPLPVQAKLTIGKSDDPLEHEADVAADQVMRMADPAIAPKAGGQPQVRRACAACDQDEQLLQRRAATGDTVPTAEAPATVHRTISAAGKPMDPRARAFFEPRFGYSFAAVRVHSDSGAARSAREIGARAYTVGANIVLGQGQGSMSTLEGRNLMAHELAHVVQQGAAGARGESQPAPQSKMAAGAGLRRVSRRVQRQGLECLKLLRAPGSSNPALGIAVQAEIVQHFTRKVGRPANFSFPDASAKPLRTEDRGNSIAPQIVGALTAGLGHPDLAYKRRGGRVMLLAEIKPANYFGLAFAEEQMLNYLNKGNSNAELKASLGVSVFAPMSSPTYTPPRYLTVIGKKIRVMWCGPGVIVYKEVTEKQGKKKDEKKKEEKEEKDEKDKKEKAGKGNVGFGIGILSSGAGTGNAVFGVAIMSNGVAYGTASAGVVYDSNGNAVGAATAGAGAHVSGNLAGGVTAGAGLNTQSDAALQATAGAARDTDTTGLANASAGTAARTSSVAVATATHGHTEDTDATTIAKAGEAGKKGAQAGGGTGGLEIPGMSDAQTQAAIKGAKDIDVLIQKATPAQKELLAYLAQSTGNFQYDVPDPEWVKAALTATAGLSEKDIEFLQTQKWVPGKVSADELRKKIEERLKNKNKPQSDTASPANPADAQDTKPGTKDTGNSGNTVSAAKANAQAESKLTGASLDNDRSKSATQESDSEAVARLLKRAAAFDWKNLHAIGLIQYGPEGKVYGKPISGAFYYSAVIKGKRVQVTSDVSGILTKDGADDVFEIRSSSIIVSTDKRGMAGSALVGLKISLKRN